MLDSIYHMPLKLIKNRIFGAKKSRFCHVLRNIIMDVITFPEICKPLVVYRFYCIALYHSQTRRHVKKCSITWHFIWVCSVCLDKKVSKYDQKIPQPHTVDVDQPTAPQGRATENTKSHTIDLLREKN